MSGGGVVHNGARGRVVVGTAVGVIVAVWMRRVIGDCFLHSTLLKKQPARSNNDEQRVEHRGKEQREDARDYDRKIGWSLASPT